MLKRLFLLAFSIFSLLVGFAQTPTTQGTEFWASFMRNGYCTDYGSYNNITLIASAKHACTVTVANPNTGWSDQFTVQDNGVRTFIVNRNQGYNEQKGGKAFKGLHITSTDTISLYIANEAENSYDAANVLPAPALGSQYLIQSYKAMGDQSSHQGDSRASFLVLATEDNTEVRITPSCLTFDEHAAGQPYTVSLNRGECYHVLNRNAGSSLNRDGDFSGTTVESLGEQPIAVFNGNSITSVPGGLSTGYDHIFEQAMPTNYWGKRFVVTSTKCPSYMNLSPDQIKVTALFDNTTVTRNGTPLFTLDAGESNYFEMNLVSEPCTYLESDNSIAVFLYQHSHGSGNPAYGDPSMVWISPVEQTVYEVTFSTFQVQEVEVHFVNIVCYSENVADMTLDGQNISSSFSQVPGFPEFSYTRLQLNHAAHTLRCPRGFVAHVYGIGQAEGYAYSVGSSAKILTKQLYVDDVLSTELPNGYNTCQSETVHFRVETNYDFDHVTWDFGDNVTDTGAEVSHVYPNSDSYPVMSVVYRELEGVVQPFDTLTVTVHVNPVKEHDDDPLTTCGATYLFHGVNYPVPGDYDVHFETSQGCDSLVHIHLIQGNQTVYEVDPVVTCEQYEWFGTVYTQTNHHLEYLVPNATPEGCDSLYVLDLTIGYPPSDPVTNYSSCDTYYWNNNVCDQTGPYYATFTTAEGCVYDSVLNFTLLPSGESYDRIETCDQYGWQGHVLTESDIYHETIIGENGCESYLTLELILYHTPPFDEILGPGNVAVSTSYWPGRYVYSLDDSTGMNPDNIHWELQGDPGWDLVVRGASCVVRTGVMGTGVLHVWTTGNEFCDKEAFKTISCSGFDVDENEMVSIEIYPNPAKDELVVEGEAMEYVAICDLMGRRIKEVAAANGERATLNVGDLPPALYLVVIQGKQYNKTKLVSVMR